MEPIEIAALYNFICAQSRQYTMMSCTDIGGMLIYANRWTFSGHTGYTIGRSDDTNMPWSVDIKLVESDKWRDDRLVTIFHASPKNRRGYDKAHSRSGVPTLISIGGNYDAYMCDATLLRMFSHVWMPNAEG